MHHGRVGLCPLLRSRLQPRTHRQHFPAIWQYRQIPERRRIHLLAVKLRSGPPVTVISVWKCVVLGHECECSSFKGETRTELHRAKAESRDASQVILTPEKLFYWLPLLTTSLGQCEHFSFFDANRARKPSSSLHNRSECCCCRQHVTNHERTPASLSVTVALAAIAAS